MPINALSLPLTPTLDLNDKFLNFVISFELFWKFYRILKKKLNFYSTRFHSISFDFIKYHVFYCYDLLSKQYNWMKYNDAWNRIIYNDAYMGPYGTFRDIFGFQKPHFDLLGTTSWTTYIFFISNAFNNFGQTFQSLFCSLLEIVGPKNEKLKKKFNG